MRWFWTSMLAHVIVVALVATALVVRACSEWGLAGTGPWHWGTVYDNPFIVFAVVCSLPSILLHGWSAASGRWRALGLVGLGFASLVQAVLGTFVVTFRLSGDWSQVERESVGVAVTTTVWIVLIHIVVSQALVHVLSTRLTRRRRHPDTSGRRTTP